MSMIYVIIALMLCPCLIVPCLGVVYFAYGFPPDENGEYTVRSRIPIFMTTIKLLFTRNKVSHLYDNIISKIWINNPVKGESKYMNLGFWEEGNNYKQAATNLVSLAGEIGEFKNTDTLLDIGSGYGEQDVYWNNKHKLKQIHGVNIVQSQVDAANEHVKELGINNIEFRQGDAVKIDEYFSNDTFDKVIALECAFHFDREEFMKSALKLLKKDGKIVMVDIVPANSVGTGLLKYLVNSVWQIDNKNNYDLKTYVKKMENMGYRNIQVKDISDNVFKPLFEYYMNRLKSDEMKSYFHWSQRNYLTRYMYSMLSATGYPRILNKYVIISADK